MSLRSCTVCVKQDKINCDKHMWRNESGEDSQCYFYSHSSYFLDASDVIVLYRVGYTPYVGRVENLLRKQNLYIS